MAILPTTGLSSLLWVLRLPWEGLRWLFATRPIRFTRLGLFYTLFVIGVGAAAINTGNNLLYLILGILLGLIVVSGFLSDSGLWGIRTQWQPLETLYAHKTTPFLCVVEKGWFPAVGLHVRAFGSGSKPVELGLAWVGSRTTTQQALSVTPLRRGWLPLGEERFSTVFPFGLFEKFHVHHPNDRWLVYPAVRRLPLAELGFASPRPAQEPARRAGEGASPFLVRDYRLGDRPSRIHWKLSAKRSAWMVNEMEEETDPGSSLWISSWPANDVEAFISWVASFIYTLISDGKSVGFYAPGLHLQQDSTRAQLDRILRYLALVDPATEKPTVSALEHGRMQHSIDLLQRWRSR